VHPELLSSLVAERHRDLSACRNPALARGARDSRRASPVRWRLPWFRVSWTHTTLAAVAGRRRGRSLVIVISATRVQ
jgi:hypothetical protein